MHASGADNGPMRRLLESRRQAAGGGGWCRLCRVRGGRQCQLGVEVGGRVAELREGWIRRMFSGASSRPARSSASGLCLGLAARAGACP